MGPATVCSCEHRSTNVPVLSFHKLRGTSEASMGGTCLVVFDFFLKKQVLQGLIFAQARLQWVTPKLLVFVEGCFFLLFLFPVQKQQVLISAQLYTRNFTLDTLQFTWHTSHSTLAVAESSISQ